MIRMRVAHGDHVHLFARNERQPTCRYLSDVYLSGVARFTFTKRILEHNNLQSTLSSLP
jgi:hypothetical protein